MIQKSARCVFYQRVFWLPELGIEHAGGNNESGIFLLLRGKNLKFQFFVFLNSLFFPSVVGYFALKKSGLPKKVG